MVWPIGHRRGHPRAVALPDDLLQSEDLVAASELTRFELLAGVRPNEQTALETFFSAVDCVLVTDEIIRHAAS